VLPERLQLWADWVPKDIYVRERDMYELPTRSDAFNEGLSHEGFWGSPCVAPFRLNVDKSTTRPADRVHKALSALSD
jgi:hypothetical protein